MLKSIFLIVITVFGIVLGDLESAESDDTITSNDVEVVYNAITEIKNDLREANTALILFPDESKYYNDVYFYEENYGLSTAHQIVIYADYSAEEYESKFRNLLTLSYDGNHVYYTEDEFEYPAVVSMYAFNNCYEYALLDESNNRMIFVCNTFLDDMNFVEEQYRPTNFGKSIPQKGFSIYH